MSPSPVHPRRAAIVTAIAAALGLGSFLVARAVLAPPADGEGDGAPAAPERAAEDPDSERPAGAAGALAIPDRGGRVRALAAENVQLRLEAQKLQQTLAAIAAGSPLVPGLPVRPRGMASAEENRIMNELGDRIVAEARPAFDRLHAEALGAVPPAEMTTEAVMAALVDATGVTEVDALVAEMEAAQALRNQGRGPPPSDAPLLRRVMWAVLETATSMERAFNESLPPERIKELNASGSSGFGISINRRNDRWVVEQARPGGEGRRN